MIPIFWVAALSAPMPAPAATPRTGTKKIAPNSSPQKAPHPVPRHVSSRPCLMSGRLAPVWPRDHGVVDDVDQAVARSTLQQRLGVVRPLPAW